MNKVAFTIFGVDVAWYGVIITSAMVVGVLVTSALAKRRGYTFDDILDIALWALPLAVVGARIYYVIFEWERYASNPISAFNIRGGGMAVHGGIIGGVIGGLIACKIHKINFVEMLDTSGVVLPLCQAIGRWGNFVNGEAHGGPTNLPWAIEINGELVHPTFLYESIWDLLIFGILLYYFLKKRKRYTVTFALYMILYSVGRFFIEGLRTDSLMMFGLRTAQIVSILMILGGILMIVIARHVPKSIIEPMPPAEPENMAEDDSKKPL